MFSKVFLAQSGLEMAKSLPERFAYMALHFSAYSKGLSNAPAQLPQGSILLLDDSMEPADHDPQVVTDQLRELVNRFSPKAVLLDFQRTKTKELENMATCILQALSCPVGVTEVYARDLGCPVFLLPPPVNKALEDYIDPWKNQGVYLEIAPDCLAFTVTEKDSTPAQIPIVQNLPLEDHRLHCHYNVDVFSDRAVFTICRYKEDLAQLVQEAEQLGVLACVGLYGELED